MNAIEIMNEEHKNIKRMLKVVRACCKDILDGKEINFDDLNEIVDFITNYADKHHHNKEEVHLFSKMLENLGPVGEKIVKHGMLVEHDWGRLYIQDLKIALEKVKEGDNDAKLDVIANAISYCNLLERHIDKEDKVIYKFAQRELSKDVFDVIEHECKSYEEKNKDQKVKYLAMLDRLEKKYLA
ncbi:hemerythrin domain-containing protein [Clostridium sp. SM-530-WT-3G]|uniref:hemerythrin domain-containing protein n=1 Tax=Clostridium sp. SM-530-WT-3G TaxID=2725303 RepID=UPI00145D61ED|nr:hemerythrin domain-containing protein [Clostridium sp. SM-530-WT-3G]NME81535.1 hemerythrin domain-containing protein [Clostridium sp. SM-530-WT-3G]